jgi:hypothetical protein
MGGRGQDTFWSLYLFGKSWENNAAISKPSPHQHQPETCLFIKVGLSAGMTFSSFPI